eukprot:CFRG3901T1
MQSDSKYGAVLERESSAANSTQDASYHSLSVHGLLPNMTPVIPSMGMPMSQGGYYMPSRSDSRETLLRPVSPMPVNLNLQHQQYSSHPEQHRQSQISQHHLQQGSAVALSSQPVNVQDHEQMLLMERTVPQNPTSAVQNVMQQMSVAREPLMQQSNLLYQDQQQQQVAHMPIDRPSRQLSNHSLYQSPAEQQPYLFMQQDNSLAYQQRQIPASLPVQSSSARESLIAHVKAGWTEGVARLLQTGADINEKDIKGWTAVHWAAAMGKADIIIMLCRSGADVHAKSYSGKTATDLAKLRSNFGIVEILSTCDYARQFCLPTHNTMTDNSGVAANSWKLDWDDEVCNSNFSAHPINRSHNNGQINDIGPGNGLSTTRTAHDRNIRIDSNGMSDGLTGLHGAICNSYGDTIAQNNQPRKDELSESNFSLNIDGLDNSVVVKGSYGLNVVEGLDNGVVKSGYSTSSSGLLHDEKNSSITTVLTKTKRKRKLKTSANVSTVKGTHNGSGSRNFSQGNTSPSKMEIVMLQTGDGPHSSKPEMFTSSVGSDECRCVECGTPNTPQWRKGPMGPRTLCNACGLKHLHSQQREKMNARRRELYMKSKLKKEMDMEGARLVTSEMDPANGRVSSITKNSQGMP